MIIDKRTASDLMSDDFQTLPARDSGVVRRYGYADMEVLLHKDPRPVSDSTVVVLTHAASVYWKGRLIFAASLEREDLRVMAPLLGMSLKELQADYGIRGFLADPKIVLYGNGEKESLGAFLGSDDDDAVFRFLLSLVDDSFDAGEDFVPSEG